MDRIVRMIMRRVMGRLINRGVDAGVDIATRRRRNDLSPEQDRQARNMGRNTKRALRMARRIGRF